jgi:hypothetical protein
VKCSGLRESVIGLIKMYKRKEIILDPKHPMHFKKSSDYNLILNFFHKPQIIIVLPVWNPSIFQQELHTLLAQCS